MSNSQAEKTEDEQYQHLECKSLEGRYDRKEVIGRGAYGEVFRGHVFQRHDQLVALKKVRSGRSGVHKTTIREIEVLSQTKHENIIGLLAVVRSRPHPANQMLGSVYLVLEYMDMDMSRLLLERGRGLRSTEASIISTHYCDLPISSLLQARKH